MKYGCLACGQVVDAPAVDHVCGGVKSVNERKPQLARSKRGKIDDAKTQFTLASISYETFNNDMHFKISDEYGFVMDYWPTTGRTILASGKTLFDPHETQIYTIINYMKGEL